VIADRYEILARLGSGGAGVVYRARDQVSNRTVALKQLLAVKAGARAKAMAALFEREYRTLVRLKHPRIIEVYDYGLASEGPFYTMELLEGQSLAELRQLPYADVCRHLRDVASSLALLHAQRLVHRDVSPRNIVLTSDGTARLLDFGALASFGSSAEVIGTPPFMAPEVLQDLGLDLRTDLYSLGAVGYFCLTGRPPYPARDVSDLPRLWRTPLVPPSALASDVPRELERLITSMLSQDPLGRPETAAAVIDRLTVIGELPPELHEPAQQSYFLSSPVVGRGTQLDWVVGRIEQALAGKGGELLIEGTAGIGKTRLASELCLAGTLKGTVTLRADAESSRASFGVAVVLVRRLLDACPEVARRAAEPHVTLLRRLAPELADVFGAVESGTTMAELADKRMRLHAALRAWFLAVSAERTLLVCVDNLHAADDDSASFLVSLGRESRTARLFVMATLRTGNTVEAPDAVRIFRDRAPRLKLPGLDAAACELLASGLFGEVTNAGRVASLLFERSGGVPRQFIELAELMVKKKIATYEGGTWVLPFDVAEGEMPARAEELVAARLSELGADAVALARTLAVHAGAVPLAVALAVCDLPGEGRAYAVLDELLAEQVLVSEGDSYRFRHEAVREALLSRMEPEARRMSRLRAAEALLAFEDGGVTERVEAALHLIDAGEEPRGARILLTAAREFAAGAGMHLNPDRLVRALCDLVRAYDRQGRSEYEIAALLFPLMPLAYYSANWQFLLEYGQRAIDIGLRITGLAHAAELAPELGTEEALKRGLGAGAAGIAKHAPEGIGYDLKTAIAATIGMVPACVAVYGTCLDHGAVTELARAARALTLFGEEHFAHAVYLFAAAEESMIGGAESASRVIWERAFARFEDPSCANAIGESRAKALLGGVHFTIGILDCYCFGDRALERARQMESLGVKAWSVSADQVRILYHALRGESVEVKKYVEQVELNAIQGAQTWQTEVFWPALLLNADVLASDALAARRRHFQLERRSREVPALKWQAEVANAAYLMLRGNATEAIARYEKVLPGFPIRGRVGWETTRAYFARALNAEGAHERAREVATEVVSNMLPADHAYVAHFLEAQRQLALAESGLGNPARGAALLDDLLEKHGDETNPLLVGLLHQARMEVAERSGDSAVAEIHRAEMVRRFRSTRNPVLIAQCERSPTMTSAVRPSVDRHAPTQNTVSAFGSLSGSVLATPIAAAALDITIPSAGNDTLEAAVALVMRHTKAKRAYVYLATEGEPRLLWSSTNAEAPRAAVTELGCWVDVARENDRAESTHHVHSVLVGETVTVAGYRMIALRGSEDGTIVGGLILEAEAKLDLVGSSHLFETLAGVVEAHAEDAIAFITA
jgi:tRNA A-37 threonylcarbamoyl transferase component Bud32